MEHPAPIKTAAGSLMGSAVKNGLIGLVPGAAAGLATHMASDSPTSSSLGKTLAGAGAGLLVGGTAGMASRGIGRVLSALRGKRAALECFGVKDAGLVNLPKPPSMPAMPAPTASPVPSSIGASPANALSKTSPAIGMTPRR
jgi:hypothetical protein